MALQIGVIILGVTCLVLNIGRNTIEKSTSVDFCRFFKQSFPFSLSWIAIKRKVRIWKYLKSVIYGVEITSP